MLRRVVSLFVVLACSGDEIMGGFSGTANSILVVNNDAAQSSLTGTGANTSETILKTVTLPALAANSMIDIDALVSWTSSANSKTFRVRLGGIGGTILYSSTVTTSASLQQKIICRNNNSVSSQKFFAVAAGYASSSSAISTGSVNTGVSVTLVFTGQLSAGAATALDSISYEASTVQVIL